MVLVTLIGSKLKSVTSMEWLCACIMSDMCHKTKRHQMCDPKEYWESKYKLFLFVEATVVSGQIIGNQGASHYIVFFLFKGNFYQAIVQFYTVY